MIAVLWVKPLRILVTVAVVLTYPLVALYPFDWSTPRRVANTATVLPDGGLRFAAPGPGIARTPAAPDWVVEAMRTHRLEVEVEARPAHLRQGGPARLFTLALDAKQRNFTLGQVGRDLIVRVRRPGSPRSMPQFRVRGVFAADVWVDLRVAIEPGRLQVDVDGRRRLDARLPQDPLENWDPSYRLTLGNAPTYDRPWLGDIARAVVRTGDIDIDYARPGAFFVPAFLWFFHSEPTLTPFSNLFVTDAAMNLLGFIPIGLLLGLWARGHRRHGAWIAAGCVALFSGTLELLQFGIPDRYPSVNDFLFNGAGGGLGILLGWRLAGSGRARPVP